MSINNADVIKLLRSDRSSDTRALLFYFIIIILFYFILFYFIYFVIFLFYFILFYFCETSQYLALFAATIFPISTPTRTVRRHHLPYLHPNPHCSPITSGSDHFRFRSLPVSITSGSHLVLFADPFLIWRRM